MSARNLRHRFLVSVFYLRETSSGVRCERPPGEVSRWAGQRQSQISSERLKARQHSAKRGPLRFYDAPSQTHGYDHQPMRLIPISCNGNTKRLQLTIAIGSQVNDLSASVFTQGNRDSSRSKALQNCTTEKFTDTTIFPRHTSHFQINSQADPFQN